MRSAMKRERSRSMSSERDSYKERTTRIKNERPSRFSGGLGMGGIGGAHSSESRKVYISNITFDATYMELKEIFTLAGDVTFVKMLKDDNNRFKGCAIITFKEPEMAQEAIESLNRQDFKGRKLVVKEEEANPELKRSDHKRPRDDFEPRSLPISSLSNVAPHQSMLLPNPNNYSTYGLSMPFLESLKIDLPLVNIVFVANLDYTVDADNLKEVFSLAGKVVECEIFKDKEGNSRGFGIVEYEHPVESVQAISMLHNQSFKDRSMTVRMDRSDRKKDLKPKLPSGLKSIGMGLGVNGDALRDIKSANAMNNLSSLSPLGQMNINTPSLHPQMNSGVGLIDSRLAMNSGSMGSVLGPRDFSRNQSQSSSYSGGGLGNIIQVSNLPMDYTADNLRKLCWTYGDVRLAEMRSQGIGMIKFRSEADAQRAVDILDRQPLGGRMLNARVL